MDKNLIIGKEDNISKFLTKEFNAELLTYINPSNNRFEFSRSHLENFLVENNIKNIFVTDSKMYAHIFLDYAIIDSSYIQNIENIIIFPRDEREINNFTNFLPYSFFDNLSIKKFKDKKLSGGIITSKENTRDIEYNFSSFFNFNLNGKYFLFTDTVIKENKFYLDFTENDKFFSFIKKENLADFANKKLKGKLIILSNLELNKNESFYKNIIQKEI